MNNLKFLRNQTNLTTRELGEKLGLSNASITQIENGKREITGKNLERLSRFFDVSKSYLLGETDEGIFIYNNQAFCRETLTTEEYTKAKDGNLISERIRGARIIREYKDEAKQAEPENDLDKKLMAFSEAQKKKLLAIAEIIFQGK